MKTTKGINARARFYGQSFNGRHAPKPKLPNCQDPDCDREHGKRQKEDAADANSRCINCDADLGYYEPDPSARKCGKPDDDDYWRY